MSQTSGDVFTARELYAAVQPLFGGPPPATMTREQIITAARQVGAAHERLCELAGLSQPVGLHELTTAILAWRADAQMLDAVIDTLAHLLDVVAGASGDLMALSSGQLDQVQPIAARIAAEGGTYRARTVLATHVRRIAEEARQRRRVG